MGADDQVGEAVAVDVAGRGDRAAAVVVGRHAAELEAVAAVEGWRGRDWRRSPRPCRTPHSSPRNRSHSDRHRRADDQVGEAVAVDVAGRGDRAAAVVTGRHAAELEAVAAVEARQVDAGVDVHRQSLLNPHLGVAQRIEVVGDAAFRDDAIDFAPAAVGKGDTASGLPVTEITALPSVRSVVKSNTSSWLSVRLFPLPVRSMCSMSVMIEGGICVRSSVRLAGTVNLQRVSAGAAIDAGEVRVGDGDEVIASAGVEHIGATAAGQGIVAETADEDLRRTRARVIIDGASPKAPPNST